MMGCNYVELVIFSNYQNGGTADPLECIHDLCMVCALEESQQ